MNGGSLEKLSVILGHSSVLVTQRYAHLRPDLFRSADFDVLDVSLGAAGEVVAFDAPRGDAAAVGYAAVTESSCSPTAMAVSG